MSVMNAWLDEEAVEVIAANLGLYRRQRILFLADGGVPLHVIGARLSLPVAVVEKVLEEELDNL